MGFLQVNADGTPQLPPCQPPSCAQSTIQLVQNWPLPVKLDPRLQTLADHIKTAIKASDFTPAEVAKQLGVSKSAVSRWMNGGRTPTMQNLVDLADLLGLEARDLWEGPTAIPATPEQRAMLEKMAQLTPTQQQAFLAMADTMIPRDT